MVKSIYAGRTTVCKSLINALLYMSIVQICCHFNVVCCLLLLCGDIEQNPGPQSFSDVIKYIHNDESCLHTLHQNAQNLRNKYTEFQSLVNSLNAQSILAISETWFDEIDDTGLWEIDSSRFDLHRCDRNKSASGKAKGGGVCMLVPKHFHSKARPDLNFTDPVFFLKSLGRV